MREGGGERRKGEEAEERGGRGKEDKQRRNCFLYLPLSFCNHGPKLKSLLSILFGGQLKDQAVF